MRYELGDKLETLTYAPPVDPSPGSPTKADHKAKFVGFDPATGDVTFDIPPCDPATENPLAAIIVVFVPVGHGVPSTAQGFLDLPEDTYPRTRLDLGPTPELLESKARLARPAGLQPRVPYLGQAIHGYAE